MAAGRLAVICVSSDAVLRKMVRPGGWAIIDAPVTQSQVIAAALALALPSTPSEADLFEGLAPEKRCSHGHVPRDLSLATFSEIIGCKCTVQCAPDQFANKRGDAVRFQHDVVIQKHQPTGVATQLARISSPCDRLPAATIFRSPGPNDTMNN